VKLKNFVNVIGETMAEKSTRQRKNLSSLIVGFVVGSSVAVASLAIAATGSDDLFEDPLSGMGSGSAILLEPMKDNGPQSQVALVKKATKALLAARVAPQRFPRDKKLAESFVRGAHAQEVRRAGVADAWIKSKANTKSLELQSAIAKFADDPAYLPFYDNRFVVSLWQGVSVRNDDAFVLLLGHQEYQNEDRSWQADADDQWQISLVLEDGAWRLSSVAAVVTGGAG
jgi:hypothetical protein